ncbi:Uncharacterized protein Fot_12420 [Forsythia ovata]|uniref:Transposase n=1 Tax=Forsythia ovata TaxID=205694 RepID=A0ABD1WMH1_9LAMI
MARTPISDDSSRRFRCPARKCMYHQMKKCLWIPDSWNSVFGKATFASQLKQLTRAAISIGSDLHHINKEYSLAVPHSSDFTPDIICDVVRRKSKKVDLTMKTQKWHPPKV